MDQTTTTTATTSEAAEVHAWIKRYRESIDCTVERIRFEESGQWYFDESRFALRHRSGKFYSIQGYEAASDLRPAFHQPLIHQPETGTQGFIVRGDGRELELLVQARTEPGNIGLVQLGPTIQATFSNYTKVHGGRRTLFLHHFHEPDTFHAKVILDTIQPELGTKFFQKWNRNVVIDCPDLSEISTSRFRWVSLATLTELMHEDHVVNNDARLVFGLLALEYGSQLFGESTTPWGEAVDSSFQTSSGESFEDVHEVWSWLARVRSRDALQVTEVPLGQLPGWQVRPDEIVHQDGAFFSVIQVKVHATDREVTDWDQPLIATSHSSNTVLICREHDGALHLLFRAAPQIGGAKGAELLPTVVFDNEPDAALPQAIAAMLDDQKLVARLQFEASDEGGRFYECVNRYDIRWLEQTGREALPDHYCWLTLGQVRTLVQQSDFLSDEARSAVSLLLAAAYR